MPCASLSSVLTLDREMQSNRQLLVLGIIMNKLLRLLLMFHMIMVAHLYCVARSKGLLLA